jgi:hypothetical protein
MDALARVDEGTGDLNEAGGHLDMAFVPDDEASKVEKPAVRPLDLRLYRRSFRPS